MHYSNACMRKREMGERERDRSEKRKIDTSLTLQKEFHVQKKLYCVKEIWPQKGGGDNRIREKPSGW